MFAVIVSGRLVRTDFEQVSPNQVVLNIPDADNITHVVVFLTGQVPLPDGMGGAVYFAFPSLDGTPAYHFVGVVSNAKPSAIFKVSGLNFAAANNNNNITPFGFPAVSRHDAQIGISIEPLAQLELQVPNEKASVSGVDSYVEFCTKMLENFVNYASSFVVTQSQMTPNPMEAYVPLRTLQQWYTNFERRLQQNVYFWK